jgi:PAS domain S-box-containing protein
MTQELITTALQLSAEAVFIVRLADGVVVDVNEACFEITGFRHDEFVGRLASSLMAPFENTLPMGILEWLREVGSLGDVTIGFRTRSGEVRVGQLSALALHVEGQHVAVCMVRGTRDPAPWERRMLARKEVVRVLRSDSPWPEVLHAALQALGECLRWEFSAFWRIDPDSQELRCAGVWRSPLADLEGLEAVSRRSVFPQGVGLLGRTWSSGSPVWVPDAQEEPELRRGDWSGDPVRGWVAFPAWAGGSIVGIVELSSCETRQPDPELLQMAEEFGSLFGGLLLAQGTGVPPELDEAEAARRLDPAEVAAGIDRLLGRHPDLLTPPGSSDWLRDLATRIDELKRLLEPPTEADVRHPLRSRRPALASGPGATAELSPELPVGLTLKAVSRRTGVPAATLRTWERRYGFMHPARSPSGYRLYGEEEVAQILQVKPLLDAGVRVSEAIAAVMGQLGGAG